MISVTISDISKGNLNIENFISVYPKSFLLSIYKILKNGKIAIADVEK